MRNCRDNIYDKLLRSQKIANDIKKLANETGVDVNELKLLIERDKYALEILVNRLDDKNRYDELISYYSVFDINEGLNKLKRNISLQKTIKRRKLLTKIIINSSIVAALITIYFSVYYIPTETVDRNTIIAKCQDYTEPLLLTNTGEYKLTNLDTISDGVNNCKVKDNTLSYISENDIESENVTVSINEMVIPANYTYKLIMPDSTVVVLNAGSRLKYPSSFNDSTREVTLYGEGYFEVSKSTKPFIVNLKDGAKVKVYGTKFNINAYDNNIIETSLVEGSVGLSDADNNEVRLCPNQKAILNISNSHITTHNIDLQTVLGWVDGDFLYRNQDIKKVISDISNWYGVNFIMDNSIENIEISFYAKRSQSITDIIDIISKGTKLKILRKGGVEYSISK